MRLALILITFCSPLWADQLKVLTLGDSLTEEYKYELVFSAPATGQPDDHARNWLELLADARATEVTFGNFDGGLGSYEDLRNAGYQYNFGAPSLTAEAWVEVTQTTSFSLDAEELLFYRTRNAVLDQLNQVDLAVIFLGGNDLESQYTEVYWGTETANFFTDIKSNLETLHAFIRNEHPNMPIVVATVPDVGATPKRTESGDFDDPVKLAAARTKIANFNQSIIDEFESRDFTAVARVDRLTDMVFDLTPFHLNGTIFTSPGAADNPPDRLFTHDDFHPNTVSQALVANEIVLAINSLVEESFEITPFPHRGILSDLLGLDPDQPYLEWVAGFSLASTAMTDDPDGDGLVNLFEYLFGSSPGVRNEAISGDWKPGGQLSFALDEAADRFIDWQPEESTDLQQWLPVPDSRVTTHGGIIEITPASGPASFFRLNARPAP